MHSSVCRPSQVLEHYKPLFGSAEMDTDFDGHASHPRAMLDSYGHMPIRSHYSDEVMYICCQCGDGPKLFANQPLCCSCNHKPCNICTLVK
ncbi:hypothetical protein BJX64DRAFT_10908 [Aspergillus heterothallicus]